MSVIEHFWYNYKNPNTSFRSAWLSSKQSETQVHDSADTEQEWSISVKCQWLHHWSQHCQQLHNVFQWTRQVFLRDRAVNSSVFPFTNIVTDPDPTPHISTASSPQKNYHNNFIPSSQFHLSAVFRTLAFHWPPPVSLFLLTPWHFLGYGFTQYRAQCGHTERCPVRLKTALTNFTEEAVNRQRCKPPAQSQQTPAPPGSPGPALGPAPFTVHWLCAAWARPSCLDQWR